LFPNTTFDYNSLKIKKPFERQRGQVEKDRGLEGWRVSRRRESEGRGQKTGVRRQKSEDRRQKSEDRGLEG